MGVIYSILNKSNGKIYVGLTIDAKRRFKEHRAELRNNRHHNPHLQNAWNKYGEEAFEFNILEYCSDDDLSRNERWWIHYFDTTDKSKGYNETIGGETLHGSANPMYGKHHSLETRKKMSENRGRYYGEDNHFYGKKHSLESRKKMSESRKREKSWKWGTSEVDEWGGLWFLIINKSLGISLRKLSRDTGLSRSNIMSYLRNRGYKWSDLSEDILNG